MLGWLQQQAAHNVCDQMVQLGRERGLLPVLDSTIRFCYQKSSLRKVSIQKSPFLRRFWRHLAVGLAGNFFIGDAQRLNDFGRRERERESYPAVCRECSRSQLWFSNKKEPNKRRSVWRTTRAIEKRNNFSKKRNSLKFKDWRFPIGGFA